MIDDRYCRPAKPGPLPPLSEIRARGDVIRAGIPDVVRAVAASHVHHPMAFIRQVNWWQFIHDDDPDGFHERRKIDGRCELCPATQRLALSGTLKESGLFAKLTATIRERFRAESDGG